MGDKKITSKDLVTKLGININKTEFKNDLNLFLDILAFKENDELYYELLKKEFKNYMARWNITETSKFMEINKYIISNKLPFKLVKDEGIDKIKNDKFIITMFLELYLFNLITRNNYVTKTEMINFIKEEFSKNNVDIIINDKDFKDVEYFFKDERIFNICKKRTIELKEEIEYSYEKIKKELEKRLNKELTMSMDIKTNEDIIRLLREEIKQNNNIINEYYEYKLNIEKEIENLRNNEGNTLEENESITNKVMMDFIKKINENNSGNIMDRLYRYSKGYEEENLDILVNNLFNVFREIGIIPREVVRIGSEVNIEEYSFYNYRINRDISGVDNVKGEVIYPSWFYKNTEIIKPFVKIKEECK